MKGGTVYILTNAPHGTLYVGVTSDLPRRLWQHRQGIGSLHCVENGLTRLVYAEEYPTITEAIRREKALKAWNRRWKTEMISRANSGWDDLLPY